MKNNRFTQIYLHFILILENFEWLSGELQESEFYKFIHQLVNRLGHKSLAVNGMPGHLHMLMEFNPDRSPDETIREIKQESSGFVNSRKWLRESFRWQPGYGAFTYSGSQIGRAMDYIRNQKQYHQRDNQLKEYLSLIQNTGKLVDGRVLFDFTDV